MKGLAQKMEGAVFGVAIGDAMGAPVEGWLSEEIFSRFSGVQTFLPPTHGGDPNKGKGAGRITDDTLMTEALIRAYAACGDHLDAYGYREFLLPEIAERPVWLPERQNQEPILDRLFWPEKYPWIRMKINYAEPRSAGMGNRVNCGIAMFMLPVGAVNFGDPWAAYQEAAALGVAHNESFAVEAGAVTAAAYAEAFATSSTIESVCQAAFNLAKDGTKKALEQAFQAADPGLPLVEFCVQVRKALASFTQAPIPKEPFEPKTLIRPSAEAAIEELPAALAALRYGEGDFLRTLEAGVFYGNDCDSIAGIAGGLFGALFGVDAIPTSLRQAVDAANRRSFTELARNLERTAQKICIQDQERFDRRLAALRD